MSFRILIDIFICIALLYFGFLPIYEDTKMVFGKRIAKRQQYQLFIILVLGFLACLSFLAILLLLDKIMIIDIPEPNSIYTYIVAIGIIVSFSIIYSFQWKNIRSNSGSISIDFRDGQREKMARVLVINYMILIISFIFINLYHRNGTLPSLNINLLMTPLILLFGACVNIYAAYAPTEIRELGIVCWLSFVKWEEIILYRWVDREKTTWVEAKKNVLYVYAESKWLFWKQKNILQYQVPPEKREQVSQILSQYLPAGSEID